MRAYWDTSVLAKCYVWEAGSEEARSWRKRYDVASSWLLIVEIGGLLRRRWDEQQLTETEISGIEAQIAREHDEWLLLDVHRAAVLRAAEIARTHRVRALDAVHLASAALLAREWAQPLPFLTADRRQYEAALALGLAARILS